MEPRLLVLVAFVTAAIAGPITIQESNSCATECRPTTKFNYAPGMTYLYDYRVDTVTSMTGASEDSAKLTLTATAEVEVLAPCEMALSLRDTRLFHSDASGSLKAADREDEFRRGLETSALRFSFQDGAIDHVCNGNRDEAWALNIKKGALSAFQNSMEKMNQAQNVTETDITGTCETQYKVTEGYYSNSVKKVKDILSCTDRHDYKTMLQMVPYNVPSELQSIPLMKTSYECDQEVQKGGVLKSSICTESHVYRPFANGQSGGATTVTQTLTYKTYRNDVNSRQDGVSNRGSLVFDHSASRPNVEQARQQTEQSLKEICDSTDYDVRPESPRLFSELVSGLKALDKQAMEEIHQTLIMKNICPNNDKAYKTFLDTLPMAGTPASVSLMVSLITDGKVHGLQAKAWVASLAFIKAPTSEMLLDAKLLLDSDTLREDALLPVSSMVNNFCSTTSACDQSYAVLSIMASLERNINKRCDASGKDFDQILLTLRAIGNAGHSTRVVPVVNKCLTSTSNPLEIRVAAAEGFRHMPCDAEDKDLWSTYENADLDSELRIAAYLALVRCPSDVTLGKMAASLDSELDEQVGAFVYSHLTNLRESSDPHKQDVARAMDNLVIPSKFESSPMKASTNLEASALINKINTGFVAESNLVWSSAAQLPRSASANLTVELFGQSINLVDFGGRLEGLEHLIKNMFGQGSKESVSGSFYGRVFGNEVVFVQSEQLKNMGKLSWLDMLITMSKKHDLAFTHSTQFMDVRMVIPTVAGLPIHVDVNGSAVVDLVLSGKADLRRLASAPRSVDIDGEIRPSAALEITGTMSVEASVTRTGLRMRNTMHTSTSLTGRIQADRGELLNVELEVPKDTMEVFDARSKFFILHNNEEQEQKMITRNRKEFELCSSDKLADITGVVMCGQVSFPNASLETEGPYFPLTGPSSASLTLRKTDTHTGYKLLAKKTQNKKMFDAQISFNTPGSRVNRMILTELNVNYPKQSIDAHMVSPWKKAALSGSVTDKKNLKGVSGSLIIDDTDKYAITSEVKISKSKKKLHLVPMVEIQKPGMDKVELSGFVSSEGPLKSLDLDLSLSGLQKLPYNVKAALKNTKKERSLKASFSDNGDKSRYSLESVSRMTVTGKKVTTTSIDSSLKVNTPKKEVISMKAAANYKEKKSLKLSGSVDIDRVMRKPASFKLDIIKLSKKRGVTFTVKGNVKSTVMSGRIDSNFFRKGTGLMSTRISVDYTIPKVAKDKIIYTGKINNRSTKTYTKYTVKSNLNLRKNPDYNMDLNFDLDHKKKHSEAELEIKYGANPKDKTKRLYLRSALNRKIPNYKNAVVVYKVEAEAPEHDIDVTLSGKHEHNPKTVDSDIKLRYGKNKDLKASLFLKNRSGKTAKLNGRASVAWPGAEYVLSSKLDQKSAKQYLHELNLKGNDGPIHSIDTVYKRPNGKSHSITSVMEFKGLKKMTVSGSTDLNSKMPHASAEFKYGKDTYGMSTKAKKAKSAKGGTWVIELVHPERRVVTKVRGEKAKNSYDGSIETAWDADNDKSKKVILSGSTYSKKSKGSVKLGGDLSFSSPFENFEDLASSLKYSSDSDKHDVTGKFNWGGKNKQVMSTVTLKKPMSLSYFSGSIEAKTPFKGMRSASADVSHSWDKALNTVIKGNLNKENAKLVLQGEGDLKDLTGSATLSSTIKNAEDVRGSISHKYNNGKLENRASLNRNGDSYGYSLNMDHSRKGWELKNTGDLELTSPKAMLSTSWNHKSGDNDVKSMLSSQWGKKKLSVHLTGSHDLASQASINGELKIQSPWKSMRDVVVSLNHKHGDGRVKSKASLAKDGETKLMSHIKCSRTDSSSDIDFTIVSPFHEDLSGKIDANYGAYPFTSKAELQWHPRRKAAMETSLNAENWDTAAVDFKLNTPIRGYRNINFQASNRKEGAERISHANLEYGPRKSIDLEARHALNNQNKMARVRLTTPFASVESLDAGLRFDGEATNFDSSADFEVLPVVGKFQGSAKWKYDRELMGSLRVDTPYPEYPYFEVSASSNDKGKLRKSHVEARLHPQQVYSFDSSYSFDLPIVLEATVNTPYPEYDNLGLVFQHDHSPSSVATHGELRCQERKIEGDLNADWASDVDGSLTVRTPFSGYESNRVIVRHQGDLDAFASHGEIDVAQKNVVADATFKSGYTTTGTFALSSPFSGMEDIKVDFKKRGRAKNFRGDLTLSANDKKIDVDYQHKFLKDGLKSSFKLNTPYTQLLKLSFDHKGKPEQFTNEMSASYGRKYDLDTLVSFDYNDADVTGQSTIKYKLGKRKDTARLTFNKNGALKDMSFRGTAGFNDDEINVSGSWKNLKGLEGEVEIKTPFDGFKSTGMSLSHSGTLKNFRCTAGVTYMDDKTISGKLSLSNNGVKKIDLDAEISTPFEQFPSASLSLNHNYDPYTKFLAGEISLTSPVAEFGSGSLIYTKEGDIEHLRIVTRAKRNGLQVAELKLNHGIYDEEIHSSLGIEALEYPSLALNFDHMGDLSSFATKASGKLGEDNVYGEVTKRGPVEDLSLTGTAGYNGEDVIVSGSFNNQNGIDGKMSVRTPFDQFRDLEMSVSHNGDLYDFASSAKVEYMDDQTISGNVDFAVDSRAKLTAEVSTPFEGFENTKVEADGAYGDDINAKVSLTTTIQEFGTGEASISKTGGLDNLVVDGSILRNNVELANLRVTNSRYGEKLESSLTSRGSALPVIDATLSHSGDLENFETKVTGTINDEEYSVGGKLNLKSEVSGDLSLRTPIEGYSDLGLSFTHNGDMERFITEGKARLIDGEQYSGKVDFFNNDYSLIETSVEINTPIQGAEVTKFDYRHEGKRNGFKCSSSLEYGQANKITCDLSGAVKPKNEFSVFITTPFEKYENLMISASADAEWPQVSVEGKVNAGDGRVATLTGSMDASSDITGNLKLSTPIEGFSDVGLSFEHSGKLKNFRSEGRVTYMDDMDISGKVSFKYRRPYFSAEVSTPFSGYEFTKYEFSQSSTKTDSKTETSLVYGNGKVVSAETAITFKPTPGFSVAIRTPKEDYEELMASASFDNSWPKLELNGKASAGFDRQFTLDASFDATNDITGSVDIRTPIDGFTNVGANFQHSGDAQKFDTEGKVTYMDGQDITGKVSFYKYMWRRVSASAELRTPFEGAIKTKAEINYEDNSNSITTTAALEYGDDQKMDSNMKLTYSPNYEALVTINLPFDELSVIRGQGSLDITAPSYSAGYSLNYGPGTVYSASGKLNMNSIDNVDGSLEVVVPIEGMEFTKAEYQHSIDSSRVHGSLALTYGNGQTISGELDASSISKYDATLNVKTPFYGYENVEASASYDSGFDKYDVSSSLNLGRGHAFSITSSLDLSSEPKRASVQMDTPYDDYRNMDLALTHEGSLDNFRCTGFLLTPITETINAEANLKYSSPSNMEASASMKSSFEGMDDLVAEIKNTDKPDEKKTHAVVGWTSRKQIVFDGAYRDVKGWYEEAKTGDVSLTTPFEALRSLAVNLERSERTGEHAHKYAVEMNGDKLLDMDLLYNFVEKQLVSATFKEPVPMKYSVEVKSEAGVTEAEILADWNRDKTDSNARLQATLNDQSDSYKTERSVDVELEHASRKMGIVHTLSGSNMDTYSSGKIYWDKDDSSKIFYDMEIKDNSRRRKEVKDGHFTLGLPSRTLKLSGSCSDNKAERSADVTFSWDADRRDKEVGIKGTITRGDRVKGDITLSMPAIRKEIRVDGELMAKNGRVILDARTDISYSEDTRKTLTLISKLEDISDYYSRYNYSLAVGVSHPYTNVDIQMNSHLGSSDEKMTVGLNTDYLTARRQNKNLGLLAEINKLKKQISVQVTNPSNKVEVVGDVISTSPYKMRVVSKVDDTEAFSSDLTLDKSNKVVELNVYQGGESINLWAGYPNQTAFRGELRHSYDARDVTEALLAVRLNTTRLLHTRVHWNPKLIGELRGAIRSHAVNGGGKAAKALKEFNTALADELEGKYSDITKAINEELSPLIDELDKELSQVARSLVKLYREMRKAYKNNEFYLQDMAEPAQAVYAQAQETLASFNKAYKKNSAKLIKSLKKSLQDMLDFPIRERYSELVNGGATWINERTHSALSSLELRLALVEEALEEYRKTLIQIKVKAADSLYNATYVDYISDRVVKLKDFDVSPYLPSLEMPQEYTDAIYYAHNAVNTRISPLLEAPGIRYFKGGANEIYQQGVWAYNYWEVEKNIYIHTKTILKLIREIVEDELKEYARELQDILKNPITVWDPEHGEAQAQFILPVDVARLDEVPDLSPLKEKVVAYLPDASTLDKISQALPEWPSRSTEEDDLKEQLQKFRPTKRVRKLKPRRRYRNNL